MEKPITRAKFRVISKLKTLDSETITFHPVAFGSHENEQFFKYTPYGEIKIGTINEEVSKQLEIGKDYYVDFTLAK